VNNSATERGGVLYLTKVSLEVIFKNCVYKGNQAKAANVFYAEESYLLESIGDSYEAQNMEVDGRIILMEKSSFTMKDSLVSQQE